jgi:ribosomal-protein-alanine N-acetyltransferase
MVPQEVHLSDFEQVREIMAQAKGEPGAPLWSENSLKAEIESSLSFVVRALDPENGDFICGFIFLRLVIDAYEISYLATAESSRRRGVMKSLLARAALLAAESQLPLWLEVHENNVGARRLYEKFGFTQVGQRPYYYADRGTAILYNYR